MLSVGNLPLPNTTWTTANATSPTLLHSPLLGNYSLDVPQGDQPGPPFSEGTPLQPPHWKLSTNRTAYVQSRYGLYMESWPDGHVRTVNEPTPFCTFILLSHLSHIVMKGFVSDRYLCMNSTTSQLYTVSAKNNVPYDCFLNETIRSSYRVYFFPSCRHDKRCYLGHYRNGTMRQGRLARQSQETAQWLTKAPPREAVDEAESLRDKIRKPGGTWSRPPPAPESSTPKPVDKGEQRRKRVRRWCRNLTIIVKHPNKFLKRCKHDCNILRNMINEPDKHLRRCLHRQIVRRKRKKAQKLGLPLEIDKARLRARVKLLWPKREEIFRRLRQLRRCNQRRKSRRRKGSCTPRDVRRAERKRACLRGKSTRCPRPSEGTPSPRHKIRHHHKTARGEKRDRQKQTDKTDPEVKTDRTSSDVKTVSTNPEVKPDSMMLSVLTRR